PPCYDHAPSRERPHADLPRPARRGSPGPGGSLAPARRARPRERSPAAAIRQRGPAARLDPRDLGRHHDRARRPRALGCRRHHAGPDLRRLLHGPGRRGPHHPPSARHASRPRRECLPSPGRAGVARRRPCVEPAPERTTSVILFVVVGSSALFVGVKLFERRLGKAFVRAGILFLLVVPLLGVAYAVWGLSRHWVAPVDLALLAAFATITGLGTSFGYHRLLTHRSFETYAPIKAAALIAGAMAVPSRPIDWAARHLEHHAHADREGDPHSPLDGFLHAHVGWIFAVQPAQRERYCRRLLDDRLLVRGCPPGRVLFLRGPL